MKGESATAQTKALRESEATMTELTSNRREFSKRIALGLGAGWLTMRQAEGAPQRRLKIGHTGITWGSEPQDAEQAVKEIASLGYYGYEASSNVLEAWETKGVLGRIFEQVNLPLISAYCGPNLTVPAKRKESVEKMVHLGKLIKRCGGAVAVLGPNGRGRNYDFKEHKADIVASLNEIAKALADIGVVGALHQHTGTCIETRDEVYGVMEAVDTRYVKFGPDVGQLAKGGADPVKIVRDFLPHIRHVHLKDWDGGPNWHEYCPLGAGKVDIPAVVDLLEKQQDLKIIMVELDRSPNPPMTAIETARASKEYLVKMGYKFRS